MVKQINLYFPTSFKQGWIWDSTNAKENETPVHSLEFKRRGISWCRYLGERSCAFKEHWYGNTIEKSSGKSREAVCRGESNKNRGDLQRNPEVVAVRGALFPCAESAVFKVRLAGRDPVSADDRTDAIWTTRFTPLIRCARALCSPGGCMFAGRPRGVPEQSPARFCQGSKPLHHGVPLTRQHPPPPPPPPTAAPPFLGIEAGGWRRARALTRTETCGVDAGA
ncbi:hypothetical protein SKAU_G00215910 [Synaphobranchus kaupii]|uniref:Uncharacterized protein n=1 Tax=Synaphobranchus kaupii TaxID=118154 RepID=A0A9Q1F9Q3_SYNKA|nr:hypothetical protein SKAU_G00215910 [Synaphobranchus kaupii]